MAQEGRLGLRLTQDIYRSPDEKLIARARVVATGKQNGRPCLPSAVLEKLEGVLTGS